MSDHKAKALVEQARELSRTVETWADFSNALSDPKHGLIAKAFPEEQERQAFFRSPHYEEMNQLLLEVIKRIGLLEGSRPRKSGRFVIRVPSSLHQALELEAQREGVSLNQLATTKLAISLRRSTGLEAADSEAAGLTLS